MSQLTKAPMKGVRADILVAAAATTTTPTILAISPGITHHQIIIKTSAGVASGAIQVETSAVVPFTGTWAPVGGGPITVPAASSQAEYNFEGVYSFIRARITTVIGSGTVDVSYLGTN